MGAERPQVRRPRVKPQTPLPIVFIWFALLLIALVAVPTTQPEPTTTPSKLSSKEEKKLQKRLKEIDDSEQYALVATIDGWYPCLHSGHPICHLLIGEVWKYGVTSKGKLGRYTAVFLVENQVSYLVQYKGTYSECLKQEQIRLFNYRYLPENLARPPAEQLPRPPYNPIMR